MSAVAWGWMSFTQLLIVAIVGQITGLAIAYLILRRTTDRLFVRMEVLLSSMHLMITTLNLQREDSAAMILMAQMLRAQSDGKGLPPLPFPDRYFEKDTGPLT